MRLADRPNLLYRWWCLSGRNAPASPDMTGFATQHARPGEA